MGQDTEKLKWLASKIENWIAGSPKRNLSLLQRKTGVSYSTLRRAALCESLPADSAMLSILSVTATAEEILTYLKEENPSFYQFYVGTLLDTKRTKTEEDLCQKLLSKDSFICLVLAFTIGANRDDVERILGSLGVNTLYQLADEGYLNEEDGIFRPNTKNKILEVFNQTIYKQISTLIAQIGQHTDVGQNMYFFYNVSKDAETQIRHVFAEAEKKAIEIARANEGDIPLVHTLVTTNLLSLETLR